MRLDGRRNSPNPRRSPLYRRAQIGSHHHRFWRYQRHRLAQAAVERFLGFPAQLAADLRCVHGIAPVVTGPVGHKGDQPVMRPMRRVREHLVEQPADRMHDIQIAALGIAADIIGLAGGALGHDRVQGAGMILDIEPIANVVARSVDRDRLAVQCLQDRERDQLFGEVVGPVIVGAVADDRRQAERLPPGADQMVRGGLRCRIGGIRLVACRLGELAGRPERSKNFVGRHMMKPKPGRPLPAELPPMGERRFQHHIGAFDIGPDELRRAVDRAVDMRFRGEVEHGVGIEIPQQPEHRLAIANIGLAKAVAGVVLDFSQRGQIRRIGELVDVQHSGVRLADEQSADRRADKAGAARHQNLHRELRPLLERAAQRSARKARDPQQPTVHTGKIAAVRPGPDGFGPFPTISLRPIASGQSIASAGSSQKCRDRAPRE